jgi:hypothetical protein
MAKAPVMSVMARRLTSNATHAPHSMLSRFTVTSHFSSNGKRPETPALATGRRAKMATQKEKEAQKNMMPACTVQQQRLSTQKKG